MITNIQGYSIHDGPGIRTVVFMKGCPLRCIWCANPENLTASPQTGFLQNLCQGCGRCDQACRHGAIISGDSYRIDKDKCISCGECAEECFYDALVRYGEEKTAQEVFELVRRDKPFYDSSGGGVTVSGGEPLLHPEFVFELFSLCKNCGIDTCAETCGDVPQSAFERTIPVTDRFYFDLKLIDSTPHKKFTGRENKQILNNARYITKNGANVLFRQPLIPGITDTEYNTQRTAEFMLELDAGKSGIELMPFHRAGETKYNALNMSCQTQALSTMSDQQLDAVRERYLAYGISCKISK